MGAVMSTAFSKHLGGAPNSGGESGKSLEKLSQPLGRDYSCLENSMGRRTWRAAGAHSVGLMWWMLAREVLRMRSTISREHPWEVMPDLYFYRDPEEIEKEEQAAAEKAVTKEEFQGEWTAPAPEFTATQPEVADWSEGVQVPSVPIQQFPTEDWSAQPSTEDWSASPTAQATEWVGTTTEWS
ncbi:hypothetical protein FD754_022667 [Muntiacus muntjak]|uniref:Small ribosomal subunit protein uS2 C-terminal domain-containing protein n=1 Tax=Muntiacus muntjak TaxID=9888 RepID=A0A5N3VBN5_MUNMU|nr:hypothetical protein FD754_022667 [Muntiacus muntjak]